MTVAEAVSPASLIRSTAAGPPRCPSVKQLLSPIEKDLLPITSTEAHDFNCAIAGPMHIQDLRAAARLVPYVKVRSKTQGADREPDGAKVHVRQLVSGNRSRFAMLSRYPDSCSFQQRKLYAAFRS